VSAFHMLQHQTSNHVVDEPLLLLETLSACLAGLGLGVDNATCLWCL